MKKLFLVASTFVLALALSACGGSNTVKFGVIGPLTGEYSLYGVAVENAAKLAAEEINAAGGVLGKDLEIIGREYFDFYIIQKFHSQTTLEKEIFVWPKFIRKYLVASYPIIINS